MENTTTFQLLFIVTAIFMAGYIKKKPATEKQFGVRYQPESFAAGQIQYLFPKHSYERIAPERDIPTERGVGPSMKTTTHASGIDYMECGSCDADNPYPMLSALGMEMRLWHQDWGARATTPNYHVYRNAINEHIRSTNVVIIPEEHQQLIWDTGIIADLIIAQAMYTIGKHSWWALNAHLAPATASGTHYIPTSEADENLGRGKFVSRNGLLYAVKRLDDAIKSTGMDTEVRNSILSRAYKPLLLMYEMSLRKTFEKGGYYGVGAIQQEDIYSTRCGTAFDVLPRITQTGLNGEVHLVDLVDYISGLVTALSPVWEYVSPILSAVTTPVYDINDEAYLECVMKDRLATSSPMDEDLFYMFTNTLAMQADNREFNCLNGSYFRRRALPPDDPDYSNEPTLGFFWVGHPYRIPWYPLAHVYGICDANGSNIFRLWYPSYWTFEVREGVYADVQNEEYTDPSNIIWLVYPHRPVDGTAAVADRRRFTLQVIEGDAIRSDVLRTMHPLMRGLWDFRVGNSIRSLAESDSLTCFDIYRVLQSILSDFQYAQWNYSQAIWTETFMDWLGVYFRGDDAPRVIHHLSCAGTGETLPADKLESTIEKDGNWKAAKPYGRSIPGTLDSRGTESMETKSSDSASSSKAPRPSGAGKKADKTKTRQFSSGTAGSAKEKRDSKYDYRSSKRADPKDRSTGRKGFRKN